MAYLIDISTAVPEYEVSKEELVKFYTTSLKSAGTSSVNQKIAFLNERTTIQKRYSCIPDFKMLDFELFVDQNFTQSVEQRTEIYKQEIIPLAIQTIDKLLAKTNIKPKEITHLITVSCTGIFAPGLEFLIAEYYGIQKAERLALNFLGCYAALKALKQAKYIADANSDSCILIVCAELCSLHFEPSCTNEAILANLLFADGAAATLVCGSSSKYANSKGALKIDEIGASYINNSLDLMTWNISSQAFKMYLHKNIVSSIKDNICSAVADFIEGTRPDYWAIHPGGVSIVQAVKYSLDLSDKEVEDSLNTLKDYGNMSSPTILFVLKRIIDKLKTNEHSDTKKIFSCAFGPGLSIEMINFSTINVETKYCEIELYNEYAVEN
jgi:alpha-pyrone synthase